MQLHRIESAVAQAYSDWTPRWFDGDAIAACKVLCRPAQGSPDLTAEHWKSFEDASGAAYWYQTEADERVLLGRWVGAAGSPGWGDEGHIGPAVVRRVLADWLSALLPKGTLGSSHRQAPPPSLFLPASGAVQVIVETWFGEWDLLLDPALASRLARAATASPPPAAKPLVARGQAVATGTVGVQVRARLARQLSIQALDALAVGDVILLEPTVADAWELTNKEGQLLAPVYIGRSGARRAVAVARKQEA